MKNTNNNLTPNTGSNLDKKLFEYVTTRKISLPEKWRTVKLEEEVNELIEAMNSDDLKHIKEEIADVIFVLCSIARLYGFTIEEALDMKIKKDKDRGYRGQKFDINGRLIK
jgi:NTP pyrophosphatase (non-canonical NTP hydrolase)